MVGVYFKDSLGLYEYEIVHFHVTRFWFYFIFNTRCVNCALL